jgi:porphobilinogen synthase
VRTPISSLAGQFHLSPDEAAALAQEAYGLGVPSVIVFGLPEHKDDHGSEAASPGGTVQEAVRAIKAAVPEMVVMTDVCLCQYTDHGHCGALHKTTGEVLNDETLELLALTAVSHAAAGADFVAPSDMMDGRVAAIREALDEAEHESVGILSYAAKFASAYYGPFREAAHSTPQAGDRKSYQMSPANGREAMREVALDIAEGADMVMVKPAMPYLDILSQMRAAWDLPMAAYQVSGEFAMIHAAADRGLMDLERTMIESLVSIKRAGADLVLTYFALEAARYLRDKGPFAF